MATERPIILAGLSNGGVGASRLAPELRGAIDGLILLSGAAPYAVGPGVPTLVIHGERDSMMPIEVARDYRAAHPGRVTDYVELTGTHFILLEQREEVREHIARFLRARL
jgi:pimeloyl-ACP methyl ester carboxylesterase